MTSGLNRQLERDKPTPLGRGNKSGVIQLPGIVDLTDELKPNDTDGFIKGTAVDWRDELYLDPMTGTQWDGGDLFARDMRDMMKRSHRAKAIYAALTQPVIRATWKIVPGEGDTGEAARAEERLRRTPRAGGMTTPIQMVLAQLASASVMRRAFFAKGWKLDPKSKDGAVMYSDIAMRPASTCRLVRVPEKGTLAGFEQDVNLYLRQTRDEWTGMPVRFALHESVIFVHGADIDPIAGVSDLDVAYWAWRTRQKILALWLDYLAGQALPRTLVKHRGDEEQARVAAKAISQTRSTGVAYFDGNNMDVDTLDVSGKGDASFLAAIKYMDEVAFDSTLTGFLGLTSAATHGRGSNALALSAQDFFMSGRESFGTEIEEVFTEQILAPMQLFNEGPDAAFSTFKFDPLGGVDDSKIFALLEAVATAPATSLPQEFMDELVMQAARLLDMDPDKIKAGLAKAAADKAEAAKLAGAGQGGQDAAAMGGAVDAARKLIESHPIVQKARADATAALKGSRTPKAAKPAKV